MNEGTTNEGATSSGAASGDTTNDDTEASTGDGTGGDFRAGFVSFVGRPNVGKSTLTNALVGQKVAITSPKPQTTRHAIRGILHQKNGQLILVDTPGIHRPRTLLGERLNSLVQSTLGDVDVIVPRSADVEITVEANVGETDVLGDSSDSGWFPGSGTAAWTGDDDPEFRITINSGLGDVEVSRG